MKTSQTWQQTQIKEAGKIPYRIILKKKKKFVPRHIIKLLKIKEKNS